MTRAELIQTPEYWRTLYENECERLGIEPILVFSKPEHREVNMATIEDRARVFVDKCLPNNIEGAIRYTYIYAANEQRKIDIEKAYDALENVVAKDILEELRKAMEEQL